MSKSCVFVKKAFYRWGALAGVWRPQSLAQLSIFPAIDMVAGPLLLIGHLG
jgi:hypothetical protein